MVRSRSESRVASSPVPVSGSGPGLPPESADSAPRGFSGTAASRGTGSMPLLWAAAFALGACAVLAVVAAVMLGTARGTPAAIAGAVLTLVLLMTLVVLRLQCDAVDACSAGWERHAAELQQRVAELELLGDESQAQYSGTLSAMAQATDHLVRVQLPAALSGSPPSQSPPGTAVGSNGEAVALYNRVAAAVAEGAMKLRGQLDDQIETSRLAVVTLARRVQASAHRIQEEATRMADRHPADSDVLESSMRVDHAAAQQARHAQSVAVLCGEWPGQQWPQPLALLDVVRAASSRIVAYRRVMVSGEPDVAATARVVEPLIHLIAELLANATQSSPPTTQVLVTVRTVQRGAVIEMDDGGVGMDEHRLEQAREVVSGNRLLRLGDLGEIPQTGMAVIGQYVRRHGFRVDLMPSPYGGVRAIVLVPAEMVENLEQAATAAPPPAAEPEAEAKRTEPADPRATSGMGMGSLPQRQSRRGEFESAAHDDTSSADSDASSVESAESDMSSQTPEKAGAWMAAYFSGSAGEPDDSKTDSPGNE